MPAPAISVVIPVLNGVATILDQLRAVAAQECVRPFEIVVVDNGSTDGTTQVVAEFARHEPRVRLVDGSAVRGSGAAARNLGVECATAERIACCDADDIVQPGWLAALDAALDTAPVASGAIEQHSLNPHLDHRLLPRVLGAYNVFGRPGYPGGNSAIHRNIYLGLGGLALGFPGGDDSEFAIRLADAGYPVVHAPGAVVSVRLRSGFVNSFRHSRALHEALRNVRRTHRLAYFAPRSILRQWLGRLWWLLRHAPFLADPRRRLTWATVAGHLVVLGRDLFDAMFRR